MIDNAYINIGSYCRAYRLNHKDVFCVDVKTFLSNSTLWSNDYQIVGTSVIKRKWWQFWKKNITFVKIMYIQN